MTKLNTLDAMRQVDMDTPIHELLRGKPWTTVEDAEIEPVLLYVRGCKGLRMPQEFKDIFPKKIEVGPSPQNQVMINFKDLE